METSHRDIRCMGSHSPGPGDKAHSSTLIERKAWSRSRRTPGRGCQRQPPHRSGARARFLRAGPGQSSALAPKGPPTYSAQQASVRRRRRSWPTPQPSASLQAEERERGRLRQRSTMTALHPRKGTRTLSPPKSQGDRIVRGRYRRSPSRAWAISAHFSMITTRPASSPARTASPVAVSGPTEITGDRTGRVCPRSAAEHRGEAEAGLTLDSPL